MPEILPEEPANAFIEQQDESARTVVARRIRAEDEGVFPVDGQAVRAGIGVVADRGQDHVTGIELHRRHRADQDVPADIVNGVDDDAGVAGEGVEVEDRGEGAVRGAGFKGQVRVAELEYLARGPGVEAGCPARRGHVQSGREPEGLVGHLDGDINIVRVAQGAAGTGVALVVGDDLQAGRTGEPRRGHEGRALEGRVDVGDGTGEGHGGVGRAVTVAEGQAQGAGQVDRSVGGAQRHLDGIAGGIRVADSELGAGGGREQHHAVRIDGLSTRHGVDRRLVDVHDVDADRIAVGLGTPRQDFGRDRWCQPAEMRHRGKRRSA